MIKIGDYNTLRVVKFVDFGAYLDGSEHGEILLPAKYIPDNTTVGEELNVFIYKDSLGRLIATTEHPFATVDTFSFLQVTAVTSVGAFLNIGLQKDLLCPFREQNVEMKQGGVYLVFVYLDHTTQRLVASAKINKFLGNSYPSYRYNDKVDALVYAHSERGYRAIVDNRYHGMIYDNQLIQPIDLGVVHTAYVNKVRTDGKIDLLLQPAQGDRVVDLSQMIINELTANSGMLHITDKSTPEEIRQRFKCSKKDYKKALGALYKQHKILIAPDAITLV